MYKKRITCYKNKKKKKTKNLFKIFTVMYNYNTTNILYMIGIYNIIRHHTVYLYEYYVKKKSK